MYLSAIAHWVKYFYFKELIVTKIHTLGKWLFNPACKARMEIGFQVPSDQLERSAGLKECWFPKHRDMLLFPWSHALDFKDLEKQFPFGMSCTNTSASGIYHLCPALLLPKRSCVTFTLQGPGWSLKRSKVLLSQAGNSPVLTSKPKFLLFCCLSQHGNPRELLEAVCAHPQFWGNEDVWQSLIPFTITELPLCPG